MKVRATLVVECEVRYHQHPQDVKISLEEWLREGRNDISESMWIDSFSLPTDLFATVEVESVEVKE